jgi:hypothetical protein
MGTLPKFSARQLNRVARQLELAVAHFEKTQEGLGIEYDDYLTYYYKTELDSELPSFEGFFEKAHYEICLANVKWERSCGFQRT